MRIEQRGQGHGWGEVGGWRLLTLGRGCPVASAAQNSVSSSVQRCVSLKTCPHLQYLTSRQTSSTYYRAGDQHKHPLRAKGQKEMLLKSESRKTNHGHELSTTSPKPYKTRPQFTRPGREAVSASKGFQLTSTPFRQHRRNMQNGRGLEVRS